MGIITIARQAESRGEPVAEQVARNLGLTLIDRPFLERLAQDHGLTQAELDESDEERAVSPSGQVHVDYLQALLVDQAEKEDVVVLGRGGQFVFAECPWSLHVKIVAGSGARVTALQQAQQVSATEAEKYLAHIDHRRSDWVRQAYGADWEDPVHYDLVLRTDRLAIVDAARIIQVAAEARGVLGHVAETADWIETRESGGPPEPSARPAMFVHPSEAEVARVLDFYRIRWQYEPTAFPLAWNAAGQVTEAFRPDFYLPDLDLYLELTTLKQSLVTDKNRKIRKFRELYPNIQLKVFYGRDFRSLLQKYGLSGPAKEGAAPSADRPHL